jgi:hypothetical protein
MIANDFFFFSTHSLTSLLLKLLQEMKTEMDELGIEILHVEKREGVFRRSTKEWAIDSSQINWLKDYGSVRSSFYRHLTNLIKIRTVLDRIPTEDPIQIRLERLLNEADLCIDRQKSDSFTPGAQGNMTIYQAFRFPQERKGINRTCPPENLSDEQLNRTVLEAYASCPLSLVWLMETEKRLMTSQEPAWSAKRAEDWKEFDRLLILENVFPCGTVEPHKQLLPSERARHTNRRILASVTIELIRRSCVQCRYCNTKSTEGGCDFDHLLHLFTKEFAVSKYAEGGAPNGYIVKILYETLKTALTCRSCHDNPGTTLRTAKRRYSEKKLMS